MSECRWSVVHRFSTGIEVENPVPGYENLGVSLGYEGDRLIEVVQVLQYDEQSAPHQVVDASREHLGILFELLRYWRGIPLPSVNSVATKTGSTTDWLSRGTGFLSIAADALLSGTIRMPDPAVLLRAPPRMLVWLRLANDASDCSDAADAIRNYYLIWEDLHSGEADQPIAADNLRFTRHFVSHGSKLHEPTRRFIQRDDNLGPGVDQFDPTDTAQRQFLSRQRRSARALIEAELAKYLT